MPAWLAGIVGGWLKDWAISLFGYVVKLFKKKSAYEKIEETNAKQAVYVQSVADEIKKLLLEGKEVPPELRERLIIENSKLNNPVVNP